MSQLLAHNKGCKVLLCFFFGVFLQIESSALLSFQFQDWGWDDREVGEKPSSEFKETRILTWTHGSWCPNPGSLTCLTHVLDLSDNWPKVPQLNVEFFKNRYTHVKNKASQEQLCFGTKLCVTAHLFCLIQTCFSEIRFELFLSWIVQLGNKNA